MGDGMNSLGLEDVELSFGVPVGSVSAAGNEARASTGNQFERGLTAIEVLADLLAVILAVSGAFFAEQLVLYRSLSISQLGTVAFVSVFVAGLVVLLLDRDGAYLAGNSLLRIKETERSLRVSVQALLLVLPAICVTGWHFSRWIFLTALLSVPLLQIIEKQLVFIGVRALRARGFGVQNVLIYGAGESGRRVFSTLIRSPKLGLNPVALVDDDPELEGQQIFESSYKREHSAKVIAGPLTRELIERLKCKLLVIAIPGLGYEKFSGAVHAAQSAETRLAFLPRHSFFSTDKIECADIDGIMLNLVLKTEKDRNYEIAKRTFDLISALVLILLLAPILAVIAILVYFDSAGKVLFTQERVGRGGELFYMYKFRSMHAEAPRYAVSPRSKVDPRITRIGRFLRRSSLDELPQLINVVKGEMSLVGPRPEMPFIACQYNPEQRQRLSVPPGITCLWQLSADRGFHIHENIEYDLYYIRHRSLFMDFAILLHTMVFAMRGV
jgi:exopolysaccharide biosynthesis polyprenyl glycosylphosphotransferase